jgi:U6 snRNA-associated Sm-like protein LSm6
MQNQQERSPTEFLNNVIGRPVLVKLNSGVDYRGKYKNIYTVNSL